MYKELDLRLTPEQAALREPAHRFAAEVLRPAAAALDRLADPSEVIAEHSLLWRALRQAYRLGYHTAMIPAELGGLGLGGLEQHILLGNDVLALVATQRLLRSAPPVRLRGAA